MFKVVSLTENEVWDVIVRSFSQYDVYYLSGYVKGFKLHGDGEPLLLYFEKEDIKAMNVVMLRNITNDKKFKGKIVGEWFDIITPYGYGGFIFEGNETESYVQELYAEYNKFCLKMNIVSEFVRFHPLKTKVDSLKNEYELTLLGKTISVDLATETEMWKRFSSQNRNKIRKAEKNGVSISWGQDKILYQKFKELYEKTMVHDEADAYYFFEKDFFDSIYDELKFNSLFFYAIYQEEIIAMSLILMANKQLNYHLNASLREYQNIAPNNLTLSEICSWGFNNGYSTFHLGGGLGCAQDGIYKFKSGFNVDSDVNFYIGKRIINKPKYNELLQIRLTEPDFDNDSNYFPKYRA